MKAAILISDAASGRDNNLNLIRIIAAIGVLVSHAYPIALGPEAKQPLSSMIGLPLGAICVNIFFVISGFLITQSAVRSRTLWHWAAGRMLRLFPGLIVVIIFVALIMGPLVTEITWNEYFSNPHVASYIVRNITLAKLQYTLPGVFETNPYGATINGSLWTLFYEVVCYTGVFVLAAFGVLRSKASLTFVLLFFFVIYAALRLTGMDHIHSRLENLLDLSYQFALGVLLYALSNRLTLNWSYGVVVGIFAFAARNSPIFYEIFSITLAYWVFLTGYLITGKIRLYNQIGDYSYGIYVYAFPMQQLSVWAFGPITPQMNIILAFPTTLLFAFVSWHLIERPALSHRYAFGNLLQSMFAPNGKTRARGK